MRVHTDTHTDIFCHSTPKCGARLGSPQLNHVSSSSEYTTTSSEFFASYCPCLGFRSWFRAQSWFWTRVNLGHLCQRFCPALCPGFCPSPVIAQFFSFQSPRFCPSFCTGPVLGAVFLCWRRFCTRFMVVEYWQ